MTKAQFIKVYDYNKNFDTNSITVDKNYRNENIWSVYKSFDTNKNNKLENNEITGFNNIVKQYAGDDVLDENEQVKLAAKLGVSVQELVKGISLLDADIIALSISNSLHPGIFGKTDTDTAKTIINKINKNNVGEVWTQYQSSVDNKLSIAKAFIVKDTSLAKDILDNYSFAEAKSMLKKVMTAMVEKAKELGINVNTLIQKYNNGIRNQDKKEIDAAMRETAARLDYAVRLSIAADVQCEKITHPKLSRKNLAKMAELARQAGAPVTKDIAGDGVLGNTKSVALNEKAKVVLDVVNELLKNPETKEQLQACVRKEKHCLSVNFPNRAEDFTNTENGLITTNTMKDSVVGDGDMTILVYGIINTMEIEQFKSYNNKEAVKEFILKQFQPQLFGASRRIAKRK